MKINLFNNSNRKLNSTVVIDDKVRSMQSVDINGDKCFDISNGEFVELIAR